MNKKPTDDELATAFANALACLPDTMGKKDMLCFVTGLLMAYQYSEAERVLLAALIAQFDQEKWDAHMAEQYAERDAQSFMDRILSKG